MICKIGCGLRPVASATGRVGYATRVQFIKIDCDSWWYTKAEEYLPFDFTKDCVKFYKSYLYINNLY